MGAHGGWELVRGEPGFPEALEGVSGVGDRIYGTGDADALRGECISVVGARRATPYGLACARMAGAAAARAGLTLVSGGARGCDSAAGRAALEAGGRTVVVSGCGAELCYPRSSADLFEAARSGGGAVVAIEPWGTPPRRRNFPRRNRVIAALSRCTLVVEAGERSGSLQTATAAAALGRSVYAVPGSIFAPTSVGANRLIEEGAAIVCDETALQTRIALDYGRAALAVARPGGGPRWDDEVLRALVSRPARADELARDMGASLADMVRLLSHYEAQGIVSRLADGRYSPSESTLLAGLGDEGGS